jgi:hypothetical protein
MNPREEKFCGFGFDSEMKNEERRMKSERCEKNQSLGQMCEKNRYQ